MADDVARHVVQWKHSHSSMVAVLVRDAVTRRSHVERFIEQHALKNVHNVSKNVSVRFNETVHGSH